MSDKRLYSRIGLARKLDQMLFQCCMSDLILAEAFNCLNSLQSEDQIQQNNIIHFFIKAHPKHISFQKMRLLRKDKWKHEQQSGQIDPQFSEDVTNKRQV